MDFLKLTQITLKHLKIIIINFYLKRNRYEVYLTSVCPETPLFAPIVPSIFGLHIWAEKDLTIAKFTNMQNLCLIKIENLKHIDNAYFSNTSEHSKPFVNIIGFSMA